MPVREPHPALAPYVDRYVGYHAELDPRAVHHGVASPLATVIVAFDEPMDVGWPEDPGSRVAHWLSASGLHAGPALIRTHGHQHGIQLDLTPLGVRALLGVPMGALASTLVAHDELPLGISEAGYEWVAQETSWETRFDRLEAQLLETLAYGDLDRRTAVRAEVTEAWGLLARSRGRLSVQEVAGRVGWSRRHLAAQFTGEYGVGPKQAGRLFRFSHARGLARQGMPLAEAAYAAGFADQAHLSREWRTLGGQSPTEALREAFPILQDLAVEPLAASSS